MFDKDTYIWFSPSGEMFNAARSNHNDSAIHECWAQEYLTKDWEGGHWEKLDRLAKMLEEDGCDYSYTYLEKRGWLRYLPWIGVFSTLELNKHLYTGQLRKAVKEFCRYNGVKFPAEFDTHE